MSERQMKFTCPGCGADIRINVRSKGEFGPKEEAIFAEADNLFREADRMFDRMDKSFDRFFRPPLWRRH